MQKQSPVFWPEDSYIYVLSKDIHYKDESQKYKYKIIKLIKFSGISMFQNQYLHYVSVAQKITFWHKCLLLIQYKGTYLNPEREN